MAKGYDNNEGGSRFVMGLFTGIVLGVGLGMFLNSKAGSALRDRIAEEADALANQAQEGYRKATEHVDQWAERGKDMYGKAREAVSRGAEEAQQYARDAAGAMPGAGGESHRS